MQINVEKKKPISAEISIHGFDKFSPISTCFFELLGIPGCIMNSKCVILDTNQPFEKLLNYPKEQLIGTRLADLTINYQHDGVSSLAWIENELKPKIFQKKNIVEELTQKNHSIFLTGEQNYIDLTFNLTWVVFENQYYGIATFDEKHTTKCLEPNNQFKKKTALLNQSKNNILSHLAGGIAHDLNNTLTTISGNVSLIQLEENLNLTVDQQNLLKDAELGIEQATNLTSQLLNFAKTGDIIKNPVPVGEIFRKIAKFSLSGTDISPVFDIDELLEPIKVNLAQIARVFQNITINAIQAKPQDKKIIFTAKNISLLPLNKWNLLPGKYVSFSIRDTGEGIPASNLSRIFNLYFSTKNEGNGIGLALCKQIVENYDGDIRVESEINKGSCFHIFFPSKLM
ncbi:Adaptive-response sensory-kinase SasA [Candidatus Lokiarchaeum ossiferum]|uniref:Adaptive-response sensory-kinase SasA n=1 Tax=Candidatus Lokiarchaeum ossiferum TaxID=2951803 RepID=A0ABY6HM60_9ARCH|nr:Adaptive-response sensory-kinase SasA [Candidatus Lokiarchaeum sp. B-35]